MNDVISRQWLIECVEEGWIKFDTEKDENVFIHLVRDIAPSAQPEEDTIEMQEADIDETMKRLRDARVTILPSAEPVIRCAECIHWDRDGEEDVDGEKLCHFFSEGNEEFEFTVVSDDYCSFAERRTDE